MLLVGGAKVFPMIEEKFTEIFVNETAVKFTLNFLYLNTASSEADQGKPRIVRHLYLFPIPYGISIPAMQLKTCLGVIDPNFFIHTNKPMSN